MFYEFFLKNDKFGFLKIMHACILSMSVFLPPVTGTFDTCNVQLSYSDHYISQL